MKRYYFFIGAVAIMLKVAAQVPYSNFSYGEPRIESWIYNEGGYVGFAQYIKYPISFTEIKDGSTIRHLTYDQSMERNTDTIISHKQRYTGINGVNEGPFYTWSIQNSRLVTVRDQNGKWAVLDTNLNPITNFEYDLALICSLPGMAVTYNDGLWGVVNYLGESLEPQFTIDTVDNGEEPYEYLPFDGGLMYLGTYWADRKNWKSLDGIWLTKDRKSVFIERETLKLYYPEED